MALELQSWRKGEPKVAGDGVEVTLISQPPSTLFTDCAKVRLA
jgi:hypothetical protein